MIGIYKIQNKVDNKIYVGQSVNIEDRWRHHLKDAGNDNNYFHNALHSYGKENFDFQVLEECSIEELDSRECYWINYYNCVYPNGYNLTDGGQNHHTNYIFLSKDEVENIITLLKNRLDLSINDIAEIYSVSFQTISDINTGKTHRKDITYPIRQNKAYQMNNKQRCAVCGCVITKGCLMCKQCRDNQSLSKRPEKNELAKLIADNGFEGVGRMFNVSGNAIKKWCDRYGLPRLKKDIVLYVKNMER